MALLNREKQAAVQQLPIGEITPSPHQTRRDFHEEELAALAQSIDRSGLLNPISVRALPQGGYCLIAGERRWRACQMLGWSRIPALVWQKDDADAAALTLAENLHRSDLHYIEEAEGILRLIAQCGLSQNEAAALLAMSPSALCNKLRLLRLSPAVQQALIENNIPERLARALLQLPDEDLQQRAIRHMAAEELNVRQGEEYLRQLLHRQQHPPYRGLLRDYRILFTTVDRAVEEILYPAMEDYAIDIIIGKGPSANSIRLDLPKFTLIGATTRSGQLSAPLRDRFGVILRLELYTPEELRRIVERSAGILGISIEHDGAEEIARRSRGTPRIANRILRRVRDFAQVTANGVITRQVADEALNRLEIDHLGLDSLDRRMLRSIIEYYSGGPVGVETLAATINEESVTLEDVYEPYLLQQGFLTRTPRGRCVTQKAYEHLGIPFHGQQQLDL